MHRATLVACTPPCFLSFSIEQYPRGEIHCSEQVCTLVGKQHTLTCIVARMSSPKRMDFARRRSSGAVVPLLLHFAKSISSLSTSGYSFLREMPPVCLAAFFSRMASFFCLFDLGIAFCTFFCSLFAIQDLPFNICSKHHDCGEDVCAPHCSNYLIMDNSIVATLFCAPRDSASSTK